MINNKYCLKALEDSVFCFKGHCGDATSLMASSHDNGCTEGCCKGHKPYHKMEDPPSFGHEFQKEKWLVHNESSMEMLEFHGCECVRKEHNGGSALN